MTADPIQVALQRYRDAHDASDETAMRAAFEQVPDERTDEFIDAVEALGLDVPELQVDGAQVLEYLRAAGASPEASALAGSITADSFAAFVRLRARQLGVGLDTIVDRVDGTGAIVDDADLAAAYRFVEAILSAAEDDTPDVDPQLIVALAQILDTPAPSLAALARSLTA